MPRTIDHLVATHELARERRAAGKPIWAHTVDVSRVFHNEDLTFAQRRDGIVAALRGSSWYRQADPDDCDGVRELVDDHLAYAETGDEFDGPWDELYDLADVDRVWIKTR